MVTNPLVYSYNGSYGNGMLCTISEQSENAFRDNAIVSAIQILPGDVSKLTQAVQLYKIHLMPYKHQIPEILYLFLNALKHNQPMHDSLMSFKFNISFPMPVDSTEDTSPTIIIYPKPGKEHAQSMLNAIYTLFKDYQGLNITPRSYTPLTESLIDQTLPEQ